MGEHPALLRTSEWELAPVVGDLERTQDQNSIAANRTTACPRTEARQASA